MAICTVKSWLDWIVAKLGGLTNLLVGALACAPITPMGVGLHDPVLTCAPLVRGCACARRGGRHPTSCQLAIAERHRRVPDRGKTQTHQIRARETEVDKVVGGGSAGHLIGSGHLLSIEGESRLHLTWVEREGRLWVLPATVVASTSPSSVVTSTAIVTPSPTAAVVALVLTTGEGAR